MGCISDKPSFQASLPAVALWGTMGWGLHAWCLVHGWHLPAVPPASFSLLRLRKNPCQEKWHWRLCAVLTARLTVPGSKPTHYFYNRVKAVCLMPRTFSGVWQKAETSNEAVQSCRKCWSMNGGYSPVVYSSAIKIRFWICFFHWEFTAIPEHSWKYEVILVKFSLWKIASTYLKIYLRMAK